MVNGWLILKKLPKTVSGQMNCKQGGSHGLYWGQQIDIDYIPKRKASWRSIKKIYQAQLGIHMDLQTAYWRCHELQYSDQYKGYWSL